MDRILYNDNMGWMRMRIAVCDVCEEVPLNVVGQRRRGRQDSGGENHGWAQPQAEGK